MKLKIFILAILAILSSSCEEPAVAPKLALVDQNISTILPNKVNNYKLVGKYNMIMAYTRPEWIIEAKKTNPNILSLFQTAPYETYPPESMNQMWMVADTTWSITRLVQYYVLQNLAYGCDWRLKDAEGNIISRFNEQELNFSSNFCPIGLYGTSKGLTYQEWYTTVALPQIVSNEVWKANYSGFHMDVLESCSSWDPAFFNVDINNDGISDGGITYCAQNKYSLFREEQVAETEKFINKMEENLPKSIVLTIGQYRVTTNAKTKFNGVKFERWMMQPSTSRFWEDWWFGSSNTNGYWQIEQELNRYGYDPLVDKFQGWDLSVLELRIPNNMPLDEAKKFARYGLGTSMLGDGYFNVAYEDGRYFQIPEMFSDDWKMKLPAKTNWYPYFINGENVYCRNYTRLKDNKVCMVVVSNVEKDSYLIVL